MTHPTDGTLMSLVDDELSPDETAAARSHVSGCLRCSDRLVAIERERGVLTGALERLDVQPRLPEAKHAIVRRREPPAGLPRPDAGPTVWWRSSLAKAAGLILAFAAAASAALPGSPVRTWFEARGTDIDTASVSSGSDSVPAVGDESVVTPEVGVRLAEVDGVATIAVVGLSAGGEVLVELVDGEDSGVFAEQGARFQTGPGQVEARVPGSWVRIELARSLDSAQVVVEGAVYLRKIGDELHLTGPQPDSTDARIRFRVPGGGP